MKLSWILNNMFYFLGKFILAGAILYILFLLYLYLNSKKEKEMPIEKDLKENKKENADWEDF